MKSSKLVIASSVFFFTLHQGQQSAYFIKKNQYDYHLAENLYQTKIYNSAQYHYAQEYFYNENLSRSKKEAAQFFDHLIGVILQKKYAEQGLEAFIKAYPNSAFFNQANLPLADYYLVKKDFSKALETLRKVNQYQLSRSENTEYIMKLGYSKFMTGDTQGALEALNEAYMNADDSARSSIAYMLGHLHYTNAEHEQAFAYFDSIKEHPEYAQLVRPYYVQLHYNQKNYDMAISEGYELLNQEITEEYRAEVHKIIGESYFMKKEYESAYPYLKYYLEHQSTPSESDWYQMGFVTAQMNRYNEAVSYYNRLLSSQSPFAQNAYYQLGNAYLQTNKKQEALSAFRSAYQMTYDAEVQRLAHYQYAKLSYDIGNPFESASMVIQDYINRYPKTTSTPEMKSFLVKSYLYSGNYKETLKAIDRLENSSSETDKIDQEVSFLLGTEEFNKGNYDVAEQYFLRSLENKINVEFSYRALYWLAQTYYHKGNYASAIVRYEELLNREFPEKGQLNYDLGYAYFKSGKFEQAQKYFKDYLAHPHQNFKSDAELRLADTYYANNQLNEAIAIYEQSDSTNDYTIFQKAMAQGFKGDSLAKINTLKQLVFQYPDSQYIDDAWYEMGVAYASNDQFSDSNTYFTKVIKDSRDKNLVADALIYRAQNYIDQNQTDKALAELKSIGKQYINTSYATKVVQAARPIYAKDGDTSGYQAFARSLGVALEASEIEALNLSSAQQFYAKKEYQKAIPLYEKYMLQKPNGQDLYQAQYELAESYFQTKDQIKALLMFREVAAIQNDYQEEAQTRVAQIYLKQGNSAEAQTYLLPLASSTNAQIKNFANIELMKIFAFDKRYSEAEKYAKLVISNTKNSTAVIEGAKVIMARSLMSNGKHKEARAAYGQLEQSSNTEVAAEALYAKAFYQNKAKLFKNSNETIFKLANNYASEEYWGAKALVVMAKNYVGLKDNYQASYTIEQLLVNYQDFPDVIEETKSIKKANKL